MKYHFFTGLAIFVITLGAPSEAQRPQPDTHATFDMLGVEEEMLTPDYWIALHPDADTVVMTPEDIAAFNERLSRKRPDLSERYGKRNPLESNFDLTESRGSVMNPLVPLGMPDSAPGGSLQTRLQSNVDYLFSRDFFDGRNVTWTERMKQALVSEMNIDSVPDKVTRRFGVVVNRTDARYYPTDVPGYSDTKWELDYFQATSITNGTPVAVLHTSADGGFYYVEDPQGRHWIDSRDIAVASREDIRTLTERTFLMSIGDKVPVRTGSANGAFSRYLHCSGRLPLVGNTAGGYEVLLPIRETDGSLGTRAGFVAAGEPVHVGLLPYTKRSIITVMFNLLGTPYGWMDQDGKRSCSGTMYVLLRCFGFETGRGPSFILSSPEYVTYIDPRLSTEEKMAEVAKLDPVITMAGTSGHIVLYLGRAKNGKLYFMHQGGWGIDVDGRHYSVNRVALNSLDNDWYKVDSAGVFATFKP